VGVIGNAMETSLYRKKYIFMVWGATILAAPILVILWTAILMAKKGDRLDTGAFGFIAYSVGYGLLLSIPTFGIIYLLFGQLVKRSPNPTALKLILIGVGIVCILLTFFLYFMVSTPIF
jgi:hypothetical protein